MNRSSSALPTVRLSDELPLAAADVHEPHALLDRMRWEEGWEPGQISDDDASAAPAEPGADPEHVDETWDDEPTTVREVAPAPVASTATVQRATPGAVATVDVPTDEVEALDDATPLPPHDPPPQSVFVDPSATTAKRRAVAGDGPEPPALPAEARARPRNGASPPEATPTTAPPEATPTAAARTDERPPRDEVDQLMSELMADDEPGTGERRRSGSHWYLEVFDEGWARMQGEPSPPRLEREVAFLESALSLPAAGRVLELACGVGHHMIELSRRGYDLVGIDKSLSLLEIGLGRAQQQSLGAKFVLGDMRELTFEAAFDGAYCVGSSFGYFDESVDVDVVRRIARSLRPGAHVVFEQVNRDWVMTDVPRRSWWEVDELTIMDDLTLDARTSRLMIERSILDGEGQTWEQQISMRLYAAHEWRALLEAAGLELVDLSGHWTHRGAYFGPLSRHIIAVGRRPERAG